MLSWKLWRLLDVVPTSHLIHKISNKKPNNAPLPAILAPFVIGGLCICAVAPFIFVPLGLALFCLRFSLRIAGDIAQQYEVGNYTLLAVTPVGALGMALSISRRYSAGVRGNLKDGMAFITVVGVGLGLLSLSSFGAVIMNPSRNVMHVIQAITPILLLGLVIFALAQEYIQSTILGVLVGMFAGSLGERNTARVATIGIYLGIQLSGYFLLAMLLGVIIMLGGSLGVVNQSLEFMFIALFGGLCYFGVREVVIYVLWRQMLLRFNDDVPALNVKAKRE